MSTFKLNLEDDKKKDSNLGYPIGYGIYQIDIGLRRDVMHFEGQLACVVFRNLQIEFWTWLIYIKLIHFNNVLNY